VAINNFATKCSLRNKAAHLPIRVNQATAATQCNNNKSTSSASRLTRRPCEPLQHRIRVTATEAVSSSSPTYLLRARHHSISSCRRANLQLRQRSTSGHCHRAQCHNFVNDRHPATAIARSATTTSTSDTRPRLQQRRRWAATAVHFSFECLTFTFF